MKLSTQDLADIRASEDSQHELSNRYEVSQGTISNIINYRGAYAIESESVELSPSDLSIEDVVEGYGAIDLEDVTLNPGDPELLSLSQLQLLDALVASSDGRVASNGELGKIGQRLSDVGYVRKLEHSKTGNFWVLTDEGRLRYAYEYHLRAQGLYIEPEPVKYVKPREVTKGQKKVGLFTETQAERLVCAVERLVDHLCGKKLP